MLPRISDLARGVSLEEFAALMLGGTPQEGAYLAQHDGENGITLIAKADLRQTGIRAVMQKFPDLILFCIVRL